MRYKNMTICAVRILLLLGLAIWPSAATATQNAEPQITLSVNDAREVLADNAALLAEKSELQETVKSEREQAAELIAAAEKYRQSAEEEIALLRELNDKTAEEVKLLKRQLDAERKRSVWKQILWGAAGVGIGIAIGK